MPKLHYVKKARKDNSAVKAGESYYWWKFRFGVKQYSASRPRRSKLTQSNFLAAIYDLEDSMGASVNEEEADAIMATLEEMADACQSSLDNMPDSLQYDSASGQLLQERLDLLEDWIAAISSIDWEETTPAEGAELVNSSNPGF